MSDDVSLRDDAGAEGPSSRAGVSMSATVSALMEERRRYESWLEALNARRAETPKHVFTRVHADYTTRLEAVISALTSQVGGLRGELTTLATRIARLEEEQHRARDERAEAELRAHVGELSEKDWRELSAASDAAIADLVAQHEMAEHELRRTRELLADAERPATPVEAAPAVQAPKPAAPAPARAAPAPAPAADPLAPVSDVGEGDMHVPAASSSDRGADAGSFDELAFLNSVVSTPEPAPTPAPPPRPVAAPLPPVPRPVPPPVRREPPRPAAAPRAASDGIVNLNDAAGPKLEVRRGSSLAANVSGNNPIVLRDKGSESAKTLKCGECGAMNYPTEWYCERCGAELASM